MRAILGPLALVLLLAAPAAAQIKIEDFMKGLPQPGGTGLGDARIADGLKEALRVGTGNAVQLTGRLDGYLANQAIKILMPEKLKNLETGLRAVGFGSKVDELVVSMNRAAERAAPGAREIFVGAITQMTIDDARRILGGSDTAATEYFKDKTTARLTKSFTPIVERSMNEVGVSRQYNELLDQTKAIPFFRAEQYDLDKYVVDKALTGLFFVVGEEEKKIRREPAARVTDILKEVFGSRR